MTEPRHIKSRERVRDLGEVYTQPREVQAMLDLIPDAFTEIDTRFLEPTLMRKSGVSGDIHELLVVVAELKDQDSPPRRYTRGGRSSATLA